MQNLLKVENLKKKYANTMVLKKVNLNINKGSIIAVTGENGSGKSTLLKLIAGINTPTDGKIVNLTNSLKLGFVPDKFPEDTKFNIYEYMYFLGSINGLSKKYIESKLNELLRKFNLEEHSTKRIETFSKGMMQKINIMQGILNNPDILVLDEPLSGLDYHAQREIKNIIKSLHKSGVSMIFTSHEKEFIEEISTRIINIDKGVISFEKKIEDKDASNVKIVFFMKPSLLRDELINRSQIKSVENKNELCSIVVRYEQSDEILKSILNNGGSVSEVIRINEGVYHFV
ncbi:ABC transporter ATP-binding protein [Salibacterium salarium]|uniref:ABC transporter ATP-binding protein n=1 Tax=Salibacterium salarium TaxID=284579 RepID=A0A3R9QMD8_9BACI|nr:ABC transporter ATP-binding protein [Salibacterium salarium]RSL29043.1 ABC transporter ATP-binding protein [Salibacterium salarium]